MSSSPVCFKHESLAVTLETLCRIDVGVLVVDGHLVGIGVFSIGIDARSASLRDAQGGTISDAWGESHQRFGIYPFEGICGQEQAGMDAVLE